MKKYTYNKRNKVIAESDCTTELSYDCVYLGVVHSGWFRSGATRTAIVEGNTVTISQTTSKYVRSPVTHSFGSTIIAHDYARRYVDLAEVFILPREFSKCTQEIK